MKQDIAIASLTLIRTESERNIVYQTLEELNALNIPVVIVDGGSSLSDIEKLKSLPNIELFEEKGLKNQLSKALQEASLLAEGIFYLHTDKLEFVRQNAKKLIEDYKEQSPKGILIPTRDQVSIDSYPSYQKKAEEFLNFFIADYIGKEADYYAGPKLFPSSLAIYLSQLNEDIGWGIEAYFYTIAKRLGIPFYFTEVYSPPPTDVDDPETTKNYRLKIVEWQIRGYLLGKKVSL